MMKEHKKIFGEIIVENFPKMGEKRHTQTESKELEKDMSSRWRPWDSVKAVLKGGKFIAIHACLRKQEKHQISNLTIHLKHLEKGEFNKNLQSS